MEDIKNINTSKAKYQAGVTARENKRRNRKPTSFFEFFTIDLTKTPAGKARARTEGTREKTNKNKLDSAIRDAGTKRNIQEVISRSEKAAKKNADAPKGDKKFNVGVSKGGVPFKEAFAHFRKKGAKTFMWNGKKYTTELAKPKGKK
jgi:hypothetical protein